MCATVTPKTRLPHSLSEAWAALAEALDAVESSMFGQSMSNAERHRYLSALDDAMMASDRFALEVEKAKIDVLRVLFGLRPIRDV